MALIDKTAFKVQITNAAFELNLAWEDSVNTNQMADDLRDPRHPLRRLEKLITMDDNGQFAPNTNFIDLSYEGKNPSVGTTLDKVAQASEGPLPLRRIYSTTLIVTPSDNPVPQNEIQQEFATDFDGIYVSPLNILGQDETTEIMALSGFNWKFIDDSNPSNFLQVLSSDDMIVEASGNISVFFLDTGAENWSIGNPTNGQSISLILD